MRRIVAVAGGFGFLGQNIVNILTEHSYTVIPFSRRSGIDIRDRKAVSAYLKDVKPDIVINSAAHVGGIAYNELKPVQVYADNLLIGYNLLTAAYDAGTQKFVNIMPNCTYPGVAEIYSEEAWWNGPMHNTVLTYGMPRKALWVHAWALQKKVGFNSIHLILPNLYGPNDHFDPIRSHALGALIQKIVSAYREQHSRVEIWGTGNPIREWGYVKDAAEGIVCAMEHYDDISILNIGSGIGYTIKAIAEMIKDAVGWKGDFLYNTARPDGAPRKILDVSKMKRVLKWEPSTPLPEGIQHTVEWYLAHH
jgi:GDP-L-fucose synthase